MEREGCELLIFNFYVSFQNYKEEKSKVEEEGLLESRCRGRDVFVNFSFLPCTFQRQNYGEEGLLEGRYRGRDVFLNFSFLPSCTFQRQN